jgi:hypothetical protein
MDYFEECPHVESMLLSSAKYERQSCANQSLVEACGGTENEIQYYAEPYVIDSKNNKLPIFRKNEQNQGGKIKLKGHAPQSLSFKAEERPKRFGFQIYDVDNTGVIAEEKMDTEYYESPSFHIEAECREDFKGERGFPKRSKEEEMMLISEYDFGLSGITGDDFLSPKFNFQEETEPKQPLNEHQGVQRNKGTPSEDIRANCSGIGSGDKDEKQSQLLVASHQSFGRLNGSFEGAEKWGSTSSQEKRGMREGKENAGQLVLDPNELMTLINRVVDQKLEAQRSVQEALVQKAKTAAVEEARAAVAEEINIERKEMQLETVS